MRMHFRGIKISGVLGILPETEYCFDDEIKNYHTFPEKQTRKLKKVMGFDRHRIAKKESTASDFCIYGLNYLVSTGKLKTEEVGAIVVVTMSQDYLIPNISNIIHGECGLDANVICVDIAQACCGYLYGIMQSCMLLQQLEDKKVVLFNTDVFSKKISKYDRSSYPLTGDATGITIFEKDENVSDIHLDICTMGAERDALCVPAGGFAMPASTQTSVERKDIDGNIRSLEHLKMDGARVFDFVKDNVPLIITSLLESLQLDKEQIDYYLFHQPNRFLLSKLADELELPEEKVFMNLVETIGNPHGASIPLNMTLNLQKHLVTDNYLCCLAAFGAGLTSGVAVMQLGYMDFCEMVKTNL